MAGDAQAPGAPRGATGPSETDVREALMRADGVRQQLGMLEEQRGLLIELLQDATRSVQTLEELATAKDGDEILVPVGANTFVHAHLADAGRAITSIGSSLSAEMSAPEAVKRLQARVEQLQTTTTRLDQDAQRLLQEMERLNAVVEAAQGG